MKQIDFDGLDREIHERVFGPGSVCPAYTREAETARRLVEAINASGRYRVHTKRVVGEDADGEPDWQCEVFSADGLDVLSTGISEHEGLAICHAVSGADIWLTVC